MPRDWTIKHRVKATALLPRLPVVVRKNLEERFGETLDDTFLERKPVIFEALTELTEDEMAKGLTGIAPGERAVLRYISTRDIDRDMEVLVPSGCILDEFKLAPQVLWAHDYLSPPTARAEWTHANEYGVKSKTVYAETERAEEVWQLIKGGFLSTASVGFIPLKRVFRGDNEWAAVADKYSQRWETDLEKAGAQAITTDWLLLEYSDVPVPANIHALSYAVAKSMNLSDGLIEQLGIEETETDKPTSTEEGNPAEKPYPNEHSCRLRDPGDFEDGSFRRTTREHEGKKYSIIMGRLQGEDTMTEQAYRYGKDTWSAADARSHCKSHDGTFEGAANEEDAQPEKAADPEVIAVRHAEPIVFAPIEEEKQTTVVDPVVTRPPSPTLVVRRISVAPSTEQVANDIATDALNQLRGKV